MASISNNNKTSVHLAGELADSELATVAGGNPVAIALFFIGMDVGIGVTLALTRPTGTLKGWGDA